MYYKIRNEPLFVDDPCDKCGQFGGIAIIETVIKWRPSPRAFHRVKCNHCGLEQSTLSWNLDPVENRLELDKNVD